MFQRAYFDESLCVGVENISLMTKIRIKVKKYV